MPAASAAYARTAPRPPAVKQPDKSVAPAAATGGRGGFGGGFGGGRGRGRGGRGPGRPKGTGRGKRPRGGGRRVPRVRARRPDDFTVGCRVKVFWSKDDAWYAGVIEDQQATGDGGPGKP